MTVTWIYTKDDQRWHLKRLVPFPTPATLQAIQPSKLKVSQGLFHLWPHIKVPALLPWLVPSSLQMGLRTSLDSFPRAWISFSSPSSSPGATLWSDLSVICLNISCLQTLCHRSPPTFWDTICRLLLVNLDSACQDSLLLFLWSSSLEDKAT